MTETTVSEIIDFDSPEALVTPERTGVKFYNLYRLQRAGGFNVPPAFCILSPRCPREEILGRIRPDALYAVRSSSPLEDRPGLSAAGQFQTFLNVRGEKALLQAVSACFEARHREDLIEYFRKMGREALPPPVHVIVQDMITPDRAGVLFTRHPVTGADKIIVEMSEGAGDDMIAGKKEPARFVLDPAARPDDPLLVVLAGAARSVEKIFGEGQDIEWASAAGRLHLLQARPLGALARRLPPSRVWTRANIGEIIPQPLTPLSWDVFEQVIFSARRRGRYTLTDRIFSLILDKLPLPAPAVRSPASFHGILYLNMETVLATFEIEPWVDDYVLRSGLGFPCAMVAPRKRTASERLYRFFKAILFLIEFCLPWLSFERRGAHAARRQMAAHAARYGSQEKSPDALRDLCGNLFGWHLAATARSFSYLGFVRKAAGGRGGGREKRFRDLLNRVSKDRIDPYVKALDRLRGAGASDTEEAVSAFLARYGHRSENEFELGLPSWRERPAHLLQALRSPAGGKKKRQAEKLPFPARYLSRRLAESIMLRENTKSMLVETYRRFRAYYLAGAERLVKEKVIEKAADIFFFTREEADAWLRGQGKAPPPLGDRKDVHGAAGRRSYPDTFVGDFARAAGPLSQEKSTLFGVSCAGGRASGRAVFLDTPMETEKLRPGDILVARSVDPGWTPLFSRAGGIVTEIGGLLSHAATVAREYGIPYVAGVKDVKDRIRSGCSLTVDGDNGWIALHGDVP
jgi:pyruvate,water dikinase